MLVGSYNDILVTASFLVAVLASYTALDMAGRVAMAKGPASGGWLAGAMYDHFGYYLPAFATGVGLNALNVMIIGTLVALQRRRTAVTEAPILQAARLPTSTSSS